MANSNIRLQELFRRYVDDEASPQELEEFWDYTNDPMYTYELEHLLEQSYLGEHEGNRATAVQKQTILDHIFSQETKKAEPVYTKLWAKISIAAAVAAILFGAGVFFYKYNSQPEIKQSAYVNDVNPGKQGATLTLANGTKIRLTEAVNGELAEQAGVSVSKSANGQLVYEIKSSGKIITDLGAINTLSTAKGETYQLKLPDGSVVWLNSASSLTYAANLMEGGQRKVELLGEAYFKVAKDKAHPFVVQTGNQQVEVLGTEFNINSYPDEPAVVTTLLEGSVEVRSGSRRQSIRPGQQILNSNGTLQVRPADTEGTTDWKDGDFNLDNVDFRAAMRKIARWYDLEIIYDESVPASITSGGWISRDTKLSAILTVIEKSGQVRFKVEGKKVRVSK